MATLQNTSTRPARWRTFNQNSIGTLVAAAEIDVPAFGSADYLHAQGAFNAEVREQVLVTTPLTPVLAAVTGPFTNTDTLVFNGSGIALAEDRLFKRPFSSLEHPPPSSRTRTQVVVARGTSPLNTDRSPKGCRS